MSPRLFRIVGFVFFAAFVVFVAVLPAFVSDFKARDYSYVAIYLIALLGLNVLTGYTGQISLGHGAFMAIGGYTTAILMVGNEQFGGSDRRRDEGHLDAPDRRARRRSRRPRVRGAGAPALWPVPRARDVRDRRRDAVDAPALRGVHGREHGIQLGGTPGAHGLDRKRRHPRPLADPERLDVLPRLDDRARPFAVAWLVLRGRTGRAFRAVRDSETAAVSSGVSLARYKTLAFGISAAYAGVAGGLFALASAFVNPDIFPVALSIFLLVGIVVGGLGGLSGSSSARSSSRSYRSGRRARTSARCSRTGSSRRPRSPAARDRLRRRPDPA